MEFEWDETKNATNRIKHGVGFELVGLFDWAGSVIDRDDRKDYGEDRFLARGWASDDAGYSIVFTLRGPVIRIISIRPFNKKEELRYGRQRQ